jgi:hypothetical protein
MKETTGFSEIRHVFYQTNIPNTAVLTLNAMRTLKISDGCRDSILVLLSHRMEKHYEGDSNENLESAIKIQNTVRLSCKLKIMILMV